MVTKAAADGETSATISPAALFARNGGECGDLIACHDWSTTPLGPLEGWPQSLKTATAMLLRSPVPIVLLWGEDGIMLYNDAYSVFAGGRHPSLLGSRVREGWPEVADFNDHVMKVGLGGGTLSYRDQELTLYRHGRPEQVWMNLDYSPVLDESGAPAGVICILAETTQKVTADAALRDERDRAQGVLENMGEAFVLFDRDFRVLDINDEALDLERRPREDFIGKKSWEAWPGSEESALGPLYKKAMADRVPVSLDHRWEWPDGHFAWLEMRAYPVNEGLAVFYRDVTERREAGERLRESNARFELLTSTIRKVFYISQPEEGRIAYVSPAYEQVWEQPLDSLYANPDSYLDRIHAEDRPAVLQSLERQRREERTELQYRLDFGDRIKWVRDRSFPVRDPETGALRIVGAVEDITDYRTAEDRLHETSRRLDAILNNTREAVFLMDHQQQCIYANAAAEKLSGYSFAEMQGRLLHDVVHHKKPDGSHYPVEECPIDRAFPERAQVSGEELFVHKDGSFYPVAFTASPMLNDQGVAVGTVIEARNIAEEKAAEAARREVEERYRLAARATNDAIWDWRMGDGHVVWNDALEALFGHALNATSAQWWLDQIHPDDLERVDREIHAVIEGEGHGWNAEYRFRRADGSYAEVFDRGYVLRDGDGRAVRMLGAMQDLTERREAEAALRELNANLESRVAEEVAHRAKAEEALRQAQKMEAVGQLTGGIAHDFNNLLTVVVGNIDMGLRALEAAGGDPRVRRALGNAQKGAERAASLTQRLLAFSRRQPLAPKPLDLDRLVSGMSDLLNRSLGETVKLEIVTSPGLWRVEADPNQLESAILNLAVNARDAMPDGGTLTIETANVRLDEAYSAAHAEVAPGQYVVIAVTDTGHGMPRELLDKVFEPFFTTKEVGRGTGLGLSMVYGYVKQSGGHVKLYSEEGRGTSVKIYLPRLMSDAAADEEPEVTRGLEVSRRAETILVVEDDDDVRAYTVECLRELGYRVLEAHDGPSALRLLDRQDSVFDLLFTDVVMPGMSGRELADAARERQADLKVLYTSGYTRNAIVHGGRLDAGVEMVAKPFTYEALAKKVRDMLDSGRTKRVLIVEDEPTVRALALEVLRSNGFTAEEAATSAEALGKVRAAQGSYDAIVIDSALPDKPGAELATELRALHIDLPLLLASDGGVDDLHKRFADDRCIGILTKPYSGTKLANALEALGLRCGARRS